MYDYVILNSFFGIINQEVKAQFLSIFCLFLEFCLLQHQKKSRDQEVRIKGLILKQETIWISFLSFLVLPCLVFNYRFTKHIPMCNLLLFFYTITSISSDLKGAKLLVGRVTTCYWDNCVRVYVCVCTSVCACVCIFFSSLSLFVSL